MSTKATATESNTKLIKFSKSKQQFEYDASIFLSRGCETSQIEKFFEQANSIVLKQYRIPELICRVCCILLMTIICLLIIPPVMTGPWILFAINTSLLSREATGAIAASIFVVFSLGTFAMLVIFCVILYKAYMVMCKKLRTRTIIMMQNHLYESKYFKSLGFNMIFLFYEYKVGTRSVQTHYQPQIKLHMIDLTEYDENVE